MLCRSNSSRNVFSKVRIRYDLLNFRSHRRSSRGFFIEERNRFYPWLRKICNKNIGIFCRWIEKDGGIPFGLDRGKMCIDDAFYNFLGIFHYRDDKVLVQFSAIRKVILTNARRSLWLDRWRISWKPFYRGSNLLYLPSFSRISLPPPLRNELVPIGKIESIA